ncbi:hypothetical protein [Arthrobacter sp. NPDC089319]|uniref:hypothetical protein n=1 Tax=Arthrobacter sp. NPDC089319 TaxID=3155915 RepID=UPI0034345518
MSTPSGAWFSMLSKNHLNITPSDAKVQQNQEGKGLSGRNGALYSYIYDDWSRLVGADVEVRHRGNPLREGLIEAVTGDSKVAWLAQDGCHQRLMILKDEGYEIWLRPNQLNARLN